MTTLIHRWVKDCNAGINPRAVCRVSTGWVVMGEAQFLPGYALLLPDPVVPDLNAMPPALRKQFLYEATIVGDALLSITDALRINYEILGNQEPALHLHVIPRYRDEAEALRTRPAWFYDWEAAPRFNPVADAHLVDGIRIYFRRFGLSTEAETKGRS